mgnify:CR=1 FL=1
MTKAARVRWLSALTVLALIGVGPGGLLETGFHLVHEATPGHGRQAHFELAGPASHADHCKLAPVHHHHRLASTGTPGTGDFPVETRQAAGECQTTPVGQFTSPHHSRAPPSGL